MKDKMTLEEYKKRLEQNILEVTKNIELTKSIIEFYDDDIAMYYDEDWEIEVLTPGLIMGLL